MQSSNSMATAEASMYSALERELGGKISAIGWVLPNNMSGDQWEEAGYKLSAIERASPWVYGDWWVCGEHKYGDRLAIVRSKGWKGPSFAACANYGTVARVFEYSSRDEHLSATHYRAVASLPPADAQELLGLAAARRWSSKTMEERAKERRQQLDRSSRSGGGQRRRRSTGNRQSEVVEPTMRPNGHALPDDGYRFPPDPGPREPSPEPSHILGQSGMVEFGEMVGRVRQYIVRLNRSELGDADRTAVFEYCMRLRNACDDVIRILGHSPHLTQVNGGEDNVVQFNPESS